MNSKNITNILLYFAIGVLLFGSGFKFGEYKAKTSGPDNYSIVNSAPASAGVNTKSIDFSLFWTVWNELQAKYVDKSKLDPQKMVYGAIKGMVATVGDPYTFFLTPEENKTSKDDLGGKFEGIGAQLGLKNNRVVIIAPLADSPAQKAGVRAGDYVVKVDGQDTKTWNLVQTVSKIRGPKGTKVNLTLERDGKDIDVSIIRDQIKVSTIDLSYENVSSCNCQVAYLKLSQFGDTTNAEWDKAVADIAPKWQNKQIKGMVLDLRDNPGGYLDSAVYLASEFLPQGQVVVKQESTVTESRTYYVEREGKLKDIPLVVLINGGSASAAEILSGALRDHNRAVLIGAKSFGKGSVQEPLDLQNGAGLHVTVAKWILPNGDWVNGKGIQPKIAVENTYKEGETLTKEDDKQLQRAFQEVTK